MPLKKVARLLDQSTPFDHNKLHFLLRSARRALWKEKKAPEDGDTQAKEDA